MVVYWACRCLPLETLDALLLDELKKLVVQLLVRVSALEEENRQLRAENGRLKALAETKAGAGGIDKASEPDKRQDQAGAPAAAQPAEIFGLACSPEFGGSFGLFFGFAIGSSIWIIRCPTSSTADHSVMKHVLIVVDAGTGGPVRLNSCPQR